MVCESSQIPVEDDLGSDVSGYDWIGQYGAELCCDVKRIHYRHLQTTILYLLRHSSNHKRGI